ncbi:unnamed protein product [Effrenium voratum]|nr:unnamed protein product [Effrenium voratum]
MRVAVLFAGAWRFSERTCASIARHLLQPLQAVSFAVSSGRGRLEARRRLKQLFVSLNFAWVKDPNVKELRASIPPKAREIYETLGSGALSPLRGIPGGFNLPSLRKLQIALDLVKGYEKRRRRQFKWLIHTRMDLIWVANHPPLSMMDSSRIWTTPLLGAGGNHANRFALNDWHAAVPRANAAAYWGRWQLLCRGQAPWLPHIEPGELLSAVLQTLEIPLGEMDAVYCLNQCTNWSCQFSSWMPRKSRWRWEKNRQVLQQRAAALRLGVVVVAYGAEERYDGEPGHAIIPRFLKREYRDHTVGTLDDYRMQRELIKSPSVFMLLQHSLTVLLSFLRVSQGSVNPNLVHALVCTKGKHRSAFLAAGTAYLLRHMAIEGLEVLLWLPTLFGVRRPPMQSGYFRLEGSVTRTLTDWLSEMVLDPATRPEVIEIEPASEVPGPSAPPPPQGKASLLAALEKLAPDLSFVASQLDLDEAALAGLVALTSHSALGALLGHEIVPTALREVNPATRKWRNPSAVLQAVCRDRHFGL